jgi:peroxiredoxin Q/BCP
MLYAAQEASMRQSFRFLPVAIATLLLATPAPAQDPQELKVGDAAPDFTLEGTDGKTYTLSKNLKGRWLVLAWFPKAYTGG